MGGEPGFIGAGSDQRPQPLIDANRALHAALNDRRIPHTYEEFPGAHEWLYWETHLEDTLRFFGGALASSSR